MHARDIVATVHEGAELVVAATLGELLDAAVQVAQRGLGRDDLLAVDLDEQTQHAVGRGMLRAHVDDEVLGGEPVDAGRSAADGSRQLTGIVCPLGKQAYLCDEIASIAHRSRTSSAVRIGTTLAQQRFHAFGREAGA